MSLTSPEQKDNNYEAIRKHLTSQEANELTKTQKKLLERWQTAHDQMLGMNIEPEIVTLLMNTYKISQGQAYRDIRQAEKLFGTIHRRDPNYLMKLLIDWNIECLIQAKRDDDLKSAALFLRNIKEIADSISPEEKYKELLFQRFNITIVSDPSQLGWAPVDQDKIDALIYEFSKPKQLTS